MEGSSRTAVAYFSSWTKIAVPLPCPESPRVFPASLGAGTRKGTHTLPLLSLAEPDSICSLTGAGQDQLWSLLSPLLPGSAGNSGSGSGGQGKVHSTEHGGEENGEGNFYMLEGIKSPTAAPAMWSAWPGVFVGVRCSHLGSRGLCSYTPLYKILDLYILPCLWNYCSPNENTCLNHI